MRSATRLVRFRSITDKEVTVRKAHMCEWCASVIAKGETAHYRAYLFDGDFTTGRMHLDCYEAFANSAHDVVCEGWMPGDFQRGGTAALVTQEGK